MARLDKHMNQWDLLANACSWGQTREKKKARLHRFNLLLTERRGELFYANENIIRTNGANYESWQ